MTITLFLRARASFTFSVRRPRNTGALPNRLGSRVALSEPVPYTHINFEAHLSESTLEEKYVNNVGKQIDR